MAYLFDTDAVSELLRRQPLAGYVRWLGEIPREDQFTSAVTIGELYRGAFRSREPSRHLRNIEDRVLPVVSVLPFDAAVARVYGEISAGLQLLGRPLEDADLQIAATALHHGLRLVTGNLKHFRRVPGLLLETALAESREASR